MADALTTYQEIMDDLLTNPCFAALFAPFHPAAVADFVSTYAFDKCQWQYKGAKAEVEQTAALSRFSEAAYSRLWDIQHKKLFDMQAHWRAGQGEVPGVQCSFDFGRHGAAIENCALLSPISPDELALYMDFVRQATDFDDEVLDGHRPGYWPQNWHDFTRMRRFEEEMEKDVPDEAVIGLPLPAWYEFHNLHTGNDRLLRLPDVRGLQELPYLVAFRDELIAKKSTAADDPRPTRLTPDQMQELRQVLLQDFEAPRLRRQQAAFSTQQAREAANQQAKADFAYLKALDVDETAPLVGADWRQALHQAVQDTKRQQLLAHLPQVYDDYQMRESLGIRHPAAQEPAQRFDKHFEKLRNWLLDGREALGEPRNFDFYD